MQLIKVYSNKKSFNVVNFRKTGPNFIIAKQKHPGKEGKESGKTYNGVGKSLLVRIIHFCLGAGVTDYQTFCNKLPGWEFYLDFVVGNVKYTVKRATDEPNRIFLNNEPLTIEKFNKKMGKICFDIPSNISFLSFRSLIPFFIRPNKESYVSYNKPGKTGSDYQSLLYNSFLLGLDVDLAQKKYNFRKEQERIKKLEKNFKEDSLLRDFFTGNKDVSLAIIELQENINKLEERLNNYKVAENYYEVQLEADRIEKELLEFNNKIIMLQNNIDSIDKSIIITPDIKKDDIITIYNEAKIYFSESMTKTLDELEKFYKKLISNRTKRFVEQRNKLSLEQQNIKIYVEEKQRELDGLMKYLGEHQALDLYKNLSNRYASLKTELDNLKKYQELQSKYKSKVRQNEIFLLELTEITENYLHDIRNDIEELRNYFRNLAKVFYPKSIAGLTIDNNYGENQLRYIIDAKIESDDSDGINNVKIFSYDLTILFKGSNHKINFIFHDSRLFDGTDERQKADMFKTIHQRFTQTNKQYIATVNQNQLEEIRKYLSDEEFNSIITNNTILTLTDDSDSEKLLGIKVDLG